ncbi:MAG: septum formation protein Maf [Dehalococcoidia bacterium]|nr:septum formation protein Maf [Dehalococcoidia bacterium]
MRVLVLASASVGRAELLRRTGLPFLIDPSGCDETTDDIDPEAHVRSLALRKARDVSRRHADAVVIGADTIIDLDGEIIGKPESDEEAARMLGRLAGRYHRLLTGLAVVDSATCTEYVGVEATRVHLRDLTPGQIDAYVRSGETVGKSGSYELQGLGATIIDRIEGDFSNVVGLPMAYLAQALERFGVDILT